MIDEHIMEGLERLYADGRARVVESHERRRATAEAMVAAVEQAAMIGPGREVRVTCSDAAELFFVLVHLQEALEKFGLLDGPRTSAAGMGTLELKNGSCILIGVKP
jgi:hypothetical protein